MTMKLVSMMAPVADPFYRAVAEYLTRATGIRVEVDHAQPWWERERMLDRGEAQLGAICGLPYVWKADRALPTLELLAAPVMLGARYRGRPVYFSDVVVRRDSPFHCFADLRGARWAFNEPRSHSGYLVTRYHLARRRESGGYFRRVVEAGAHEAALRMVLAGEVDASAIDSTVLEMHAAQEPQIRAAVRVVETLGPSPVPPLVASTCLPAALRRTVRRALLRMDQDPRAAAALRAAGVRRLVAAQDRDYDVIRRMERAAAGAELEPGVSPHAAVT